MEENISHNQPVQTSGEKKENSFWEIIRFVVITLLIVIPVRIYIAQPFIVSGPSMDPTFHDGQYLIVDELSYRFSAPKRDEVVIFNHPKEKGKVLIKRIIGLPGETLEFNGDHLIIKSAENPKGFELDQSFVKNVFPEPKRTVVLGPTEYFALGDNRPISYDSRSWGTITQKDLIGRPLFRLWPISSISIFPGVPKTVSKL
jgi:signal peptidase I